MPRILHAGGAATGIEVERALVEAVRATAAALHEHTFAVDLVVEHGQCRGVLAVDGDGRRHEVRAANVLVATGGAGQLFAVTTNPPEATGDGAAMALRAGAAVADVEFVQFHPTALHHPAMPRPLLSEALRGHGALIRDTTGARFVDELLPRDQVSLAMMRQMLELDVDHCFLDARHLDHFGERFPTIAAALDNVGLDPSTDLLPIAPAAHYHCGGILTDLHGATTLPGLWAAGEAADAGVHGANRLASNSLLDGMVFGFRSVEAIEAGRVGPTPTGAMRAVLAADAYEADDGSWHGLPGRLLPNPAAEGHQGGAPRSAATVSEPSALRDEVQNVLTRFAGVLRNAESLATARRELERLGDQLVEPRAAGPADLEVRNLVEVGRALLAAATARTESRGCHSRTDHTATDDELLARFVIGAHAAG